MGKKNLGQKKIWGKKWPQKGSLPQRGHKLAPIGISSFAGGDILKSCVQFKFEAKWLTIALFRTGRTFWDPKLPHFQKEIRNFHTATF